MTFSIKQQPSSRVFIVPPLSRRLSFESCSPGQVMGAVSHHPEASSSSGGGAALPSKRANPTQEPDGVGVVREGSSATMEWFGRTAGLQRAEAWERIELENIEESSRKTLFQQEFLHRKEAQICYRRCNSSTLLSLFQLHSVEITEQTVRKELYVQIAREWDQFRTMYLQSVAPSGAPITGSGETSVVPAKAVVQNDRPPPGTIRRRRSLIPLADPGPLSMSNRTLADAPVAASLPPPPSTLPPLVAPPARIRNPLGNVQHRSVSMAPITSVSHLPPSLLHRRAFSVVPFASSSVVLPPLHPTADPLPNLFRTEPLMMMMAPPQYQYRFDYR